MSARKTITRAACALALLCSSSACFTTTLRSGTPANPARVENDRRWHHGVIWGIAELSGPYNLKQLCPNGWAEVTTETSFLNGLLGAITSSIYSPQTVTVRCSGEEAEPTQGEQEPAEAAAESGKRSL
jgi:hypothetical protein